jgi:hypothetical protein
MGEPRYTGPFRVAGWEFYGNGGIGRRNLDVEDWIELVNKIRK